MILLFPFFIIFYFTATFLLLRYFKRRGWSNWKISFSALLIASILVIDIPFGKFVFENMCKTEAGFVVWKTVKTDGFIFINERKGSLFQVRGLPLTLHYPKNIEEFIYVETEVTQPEERYLASAPGKYRYTLENNGSNKCALFNQLTAQQKNGIFGYYKDEDVIFKESQDPTSSNTADAPAVCVGAEKIENFTPRYTFIRADEPFYLRWLGITYFTYTRIVDNQTNQTIAQDFDPKWTGGWLADTFFNLNMPHESTRPCKVTKYKERPGGNLVSWLYEVFK